MKEKIEEYIETINEEINKYQSSQSIMLQTRVDTLTKVKQRLQNILSEHLQELQK